MTFPRRVLVTGSRSWSDWDLMRAALAEVAGPGVVLVHGGARGADRMAASIWRRWGLRCEVHVADWGRYGNRAGIVRNQEMVTAGADVCVAFIRAQSRGATHCATAAEAAGIPTRRYETTLDARTRKGEAR